MTAYRASYSDRFGQEQTVIENDGRVLRLLLRGVEFAGRDFDGLEAVSPWSEERIPRFTLNNGDLCDCVIECDIPLSVVSAEGATEGRLHVHLDLGGPVERGHIAHEALLLRLYAVPGVFAPRDVSKSFETGLLDIQRTLPDGAFLKCCFGCAFAGYSPFGGGMWGMFCHRNQKSEYLRAQSKPEWFRLNDGAAEFVQEIHLCAEFEPWDGKTGYRDPLQTQGSRNA